MVRVTANTPFMKLELHDRPCQMAYSTDNSIFFIDMDSLEEFEVRNDLVRDRLRGILQTGIYIIHIV